MNENNDRISISSCRRLVSRVSSRTALLVGVAAVGTVGVVHAAVPGDNTALVYSGVLEDNGTLVTGTRAVSFSIFNAAAAGTRICGPVDQPATTFVSGHFSVALPASCAVALRGDTDAFVEVSVDDSPVGARTRVGAVPYALQAGRANAAEDVVPGSTLATRIDTLEANPIGTVIEDSDDTAQVGSIQEDLVYDSCQVSLTPGTWLVTAYASLASLSEADDLQLALVNAVGNVELPHSRSGVAGAGTVDNSFAVTTTTVVELNATTVLKMKGVRNGNSIVKFRGIEGLSILPGHQRMIAVRLK